MSVKICLLLTILCNALCWSEPSSNQMMSLSSSPNAGWAHFVNLVAPARTPCAEKLVKIRQPHQPAEAGSRSLYQKELFLFFIFLFLLSTCSVSLVKQRVYTRKIWQETNFHFVFFFHQHVHALLLLSSFTFLCLSLHMNSEDELAERNDSGDTYLLTRASCRHDGLLTAISLSAM